MACISCPGTGRFPGEPWILSSGNSVESQPSCRGARHPRSALCCLQSLSAHSLTWVGIFVGICACLLASTSASQEFALGVRPPPHPPGPPWLQLDAPLMSPRQQREAWLPPFDTCSLESLETPPGTWRASALVVPPTLLLLFFSALFLCVLHTERTWTQSFPISMGPS